MAPKKKQTFQITLELPAGDAPMVDLGKMLGQTGVNLMEVKRSYDASTAGQRGDVVPVVVTVFEDRTFELRLKTPPTAFLIKKALGGKGSARPGHDNAGSLTTGAAARDRGTQAAGPEHDGPRRGDADHRGHRPFDGSVHSGMRDRPAALPPFRTLDPALATAERLLSNGDRRLSTVVFVLPDETAAAELLNEVLAGCGASPRLRAAGTSWRVVHVAAAGRDTELVVAAGGWPRWWRWPGGGG